MIKAVLVVKDKEPEVVEIERGLESYYKVLQKSLSEEELQLSPINGVEFFGIEGADNVSGMVEQESACYPYERNRTWHGPALFTEFDYEGQTVSMSEENIQKLLSKYSLENAIKSPSKFINEFLDKYARQEIHNYSYGIHEGILNTMDAADMLRGETDEIGIKEIESSFVNIVMTACNRGVLIEDVLTGYLKSINKDVFRQQVKDFEKQF